ncbi:MAG TPA: acetyl-CoA carboxylase biotin carboxyl carrier protein subunit, partial [Sphingomonadales bacterium]|nr:acetyl-CoA carboxylase biotin carboxyl carrier protein subunit [Sphingomonadales bacterium]
MATLKDAKKTIEEMAALLGQNDLSEIEIEQDGLRIRVARAAAHFATVPPAAVSSGLQASPPKATLPPEAKAAPAKPSPALDPGCVKSPMVGTAYLSPEPGAAPFVKAGDKVKKGQTVLIVEAMKVMNP